MNSSPLLSIVIPTFNRAKYLGYCLRDVSTAVRDFSKDIEIRVVDNASTDSTADVVNSMVAQGHSVIYHRNKENIGGDANFRRAMELGRGDHVWVLGDDDLVHPDSLRRVVNYLRNGSKSVYVFETIPIALCAAEGPWNRFGFLRDRELTFDSPDRVLEKFGFKLGFISRVILPRDLALALPLENYRQFEQYGFSFMVSVYHVMKQVRNLLYLSKPLVANRVGAGTGHGWDRIFVEGPGHVLDLLQEWGFTRAACRVALRQAFYSFVLPELAARKARGEDIRSLLARAGQRFGTLEQRVMLNALDFTSAQTLRTVRILRRLSKRIAFGLTMNR